MMDLATLKTEKSAPKTQFCFLLDATGSMDVYIKIVQQSLLGVFEIFRKYKLSNSVQIGFVFYRDFSEEDQEYTKQMKDCKPPGWQPQKKIEFIDFKMFTEETAQLGGNIYGLLEDLSKRCDGGDDYAEDIAGGFRKMLELNWSQSPYTTKIAVLITDAPCHGKEFHTTNELDDYEDLTKKPEADIRPLLDQLMLKSINLSIIEINTKTNIMVNVIQDYYKAKDMNYQLQAVPLVKDLNQLMKLIESSQGYLSETQIQQLAQQLMEKLNLTLIKFNK